MQVQKIAYLQFADVWLPIVCKFAEICFALRKRRPIPADDVAGAFGPGPIRQYPIGQTWNR